MILRALFVRPVLRRPWRFLTTMLGVAAGVASVVATVTANRAAVASMREGIVEISGRTRLEITSSGGLDDGILSALRPVSDDAVIVPVVDEVALVPRMGEAVRLLGLDLLVDGAVRDIDISGASALASVQALLTRRDVLLPDTLAKRLGLRAGDTLDVSVRARPMALTVAGTFVPRRFASAWDHVLILDIALAQELFGRQGRIDRVQLLPRAGITADELRVRLTPLLPADARITTPSGRGEATNRMVRALEFNLTALSGISLLVGAVLVATTLATSVVQRRNLIALLASLGAPRRRIRRAVLAEAAAIGVLGGGLGVALGVLGAHAALVSVRATVSAAVQSGIPPAAIRFDPWVALAGVVMGLMVSLLAALLPVIEAQRVPPVQGLTGERPLFLSLPARASSIAAGLACLLAGWWLAFLPAVGDLPVAALAGALCLLASLLATAGVAVDALGRLPSVAVLRGLGTPLRIAAAALAAGRRRAAWAAGAVGVSVALAVAIATMVHSFRTTVVDWTEQGMRSDLWIRPAAGSTGFQVGRLDPEIVRIAERLFGPEAVDPFHTAEGTANGRLVTVAGGAMTVVARHGGVPFVGGRDSRDVFRETATVHGIVINEPLSRRLGIAAGDALTLQTPGGALQRRVTGVFFDYSHNQGMAVMNLPDFLALYPDDGPQEIAVFLPPGSDAAQARDRFLAALGGRWVVDTFLNRELRHEVVSIFDRTFAITTALQVVAAVVAVIAVLTVLFALLSERQRDLALLRALGGSRGQVGRVVLLEAGLLGLTGAVGGLLVGLAVGLVLVKVVNVQSFGWTLRLLPPWGAIAVTGAWVVGACLLAGLAPALTAMHMTPREALREEG